MNAVLSEDGHITLPAPLRRRLHLAAGQDFEIILEDDDTISLRRITRPPNDGLIDHLLACPAPFEVPPRAADTTAPLHL